MKLEFDEEAVKKPKKNGTKDSTMMAFSILAFVILVLFAILTDIVKIVLWFKTSFQGN